MVITLVTVITFYFKRGLLVSLLRVKSTTRGEFSEVNWFATRLRTVTAGQAINETKLHKQWLQRCGRCANDADSNLGYHPDVWSSGAGRVVAEVGNGNVVDSQDNCDARTSPACQWTEG